MLGFYQQHKKVYDKSLHLSEETDRLITQLTKQLSIDIGVVGDLSVFRSSLEKEILCVCDIKLQEKDLDQMERDLKDGKMDQIIFSDTPHLTSELKYFIENRNRSFCQTLLMKTTSLHTLQYWFDQNMVKLPKDVLILAIHLKSDKIVFEYLKDNTDLFLKLSLQDQKDLLRRAKIKLKDSHKESYEFLSDHFNKSIHNKPTP